jgi:hypothetical protein
MTIAATLTDAAAPQTPKMNQLPNTTNTVVIRTDFENIRKRGRRLARTGSRPRS